MEPRRTPGKPLVWVPGLVAIADDYRGELGSEDLLKLRVVLVDVVFFELVLAASDRPAAGVDRASSGLGDDANDIDFAVAGANEATESRRVVELVALRDDLGRARLDYFANPARARLRGRA